MPPRPSSLGDLKASGYAHRSVKQELRANLVDLLSSGRPLFSSIIGYEDSVVPAVERAILAGHDVILLGERGQAKSRLMRHVTELLDDEVPVVQGCEINDHPYRPACSRCRALVSERGDETAVSWMSRDRRYVEKLATPDTSVADLIGDVDPIRVAEGRYLSDELTIHFGLVPRSNRGIVAINELPDLPERIQVALFNILEERDVQIRGYTVRLPLDLMLIASANPEDYTHRGRIVSPLKDRFGSQIRTHYPESIADEIAIMDQEATPAPEATQMKIPGFVKEIVAELAAQLRTSSMINQRSGVSVRFSIGALEILAASALRRAVRNREHVAVPRVSDLWAILPELMGRIEFEALEEGREHEIMARALRHALIDVWRRRAGGRDYSTIVAAFDAGAQVDLSDDTSARSLIDQMQMTPQLQKLAEALGVGALGPAGLATTLEFCLEGLHLSKRLNKHTTGRSEWRFTGEES